MHAPLGPRPLEAGRFDPVRGRATHGARMLPGPPRAPVHPPLPHRRALCARVRVCRCATEDDIFAALGLAYVEPTERRGKNDLLFRESGRQVFASKHEGQAAGLLGGPADDDDDDDAPRMVLQMK